MIARSASTRLRKARVSISRIPSADQKNVVHWVAMTPSVVRVIRYDRPVRNDDGPNAVRAAASASRKIRALVGGGLLFQQPDQDAGLARLRVPEAAQELRLGRRRDQVELVRPGCVPAPALGQGRDPAVGVEHRGQRQHLRDRPRGSGTGIAAIRCSTSPRSASVCGRDRVAHGHDQLDQADPAQLATRPSGNPCTTRVSRPKQVDVVGLVTQADHPQRQRHDHERPRRRRSRPDGERPRRSAGSSPRPLASSSPRGPGSPGGTGAASRSAR